MSETSETETQQCQSREMNGEQCDREATQYIDYDVPRGDVETYVYCDEHADSFANKASTSVLNRGELP